MVSDLIFGFAVFAVSIVAIPVLIVSAAGAGILASFAAGVDCVIG